MEDGPPPTKTLPASNGGGKKPPRFCSRKTAGRGAADRLDMSGSSKKELRQWLEEDSTKQKVLSLRRVPFEVGNSAGVTRAAGYGGDAMPSSSTITAAVCERMSKLLCARVMALPLLWFRGLPMFSPEGGGFTSRSFPILVGGHTRRDDGVSKLKL
jgi:hypothetical protein